MAGANSIVEYQTYFLPLLTSLKEFVLEFNNLIEYFHRFIKFLGAK